MNETTENFFKVMAEFQWPEDLKISYKLYYDPDGRPLSYTVEDLPGDYIEITREDFWLASMDSRVVGGKLVHPTKTITTKLRPSSTGTPCHPNDISVVVDNAGPNKKWSISSNGKD